MYKLLFIGAFPPSKRFVYGGQLSACSLLSSSALFADFNVYYFDTSQVSNPPPSLLFRLFFSIVRFFHFLLVAIFFRPTISYIFISSGLSIIEKSLMVYILDLLGTQSIAFPRSSLLIRNYYSSCVFKFFVDYLLSRSRYIICQGDQLRQFFLKSSYFSSSQLRIIPNWTASSEFLSLGKNRLTNVGLGNESVFTVAFVGWYEEFKGIYEILEVISRFSQQSFEIKFLFIGGGSLCPEIDELALSLNNSCSPTQVINLNALSRSQIPSYLISAHTFILPSYSEGLPNALIEAISLGIPSIVTSVGNIPSFFKDEVHALLISPRSSNELFHAINRLFSSPDLRLTLSRNGYNLASSTFSLDKAVSQLNTLNSFLLQKNV